MHLYVLVCQQSVSCAINYMSSLKVRVDLCISGVFVCAHTCLCVCVCVCMQVCAQTQSHTHTQTQTDTPTDMHMHADRHRCIQTHNCKNIAYIHTYINTWGKGVYYGVLHEKDKTLVVFFNLYQCKTYYIM